MAVVVGVALGHPEATAGAGSRSRGAPMSWVNLEYTDTLGPEADIPALLAKLAGAMHASGGFEPNEVRASATKLTEYVVGDERSDRAALAATLCLDAGQSEEFKSQLLSRLLG